MSAAGKKTETTTNGLMSVVGGQGVLTAAKILVDKQFVTLTELHEKIDEIRKRYE